MKAHFRRLGCAALSAAVLLLAPSPGQAAILAPGGVVIPDVLTDPVAPGDIEAFLDDLVFSTPFYSGTLSVAVVRNSGGTLDFYYQVTNDASSIHSLSRNTNSLFTDGLTPFVTDVFYRDDNAATPTVFVAGSAGATPVEADRSATGAVVGFNFIGGGQSINPGEQSKILVIRTDATDFAQTGFASVLNGVPAFVGDVFMPIAAAAPIPEPASLLLLSSAFGAASYVARHRKRRKTANT